MSWDVSRIGAEFAILDEKYAELRKRLGVSRDGELWTDWIAEAERRSGNRWRAVAADLRRARKGRTARPLLRAAIPAVSPHAWIELHSRRTARAIEPAWRDEAEEWLRTIRTRSPIHV